MLSTIGKLSTYHAAKLQLENLTNELKQTKNSLQGPTTVKHKACSENLKHSTSNFDSKRGNKRENTEARDFSLCLSSRSSATAILELSAPHDAAKKKFWS